MLYRPKLLNGKLVALSWPIAMFSMLNGICWPLEDKAKMGFKVFDRCYFILFIIVFAQHNLAQLLYLIANNDDIDKMLTDMPAYLVQTETALCCVYIGLYKHKFKKLMQKFYNDIYIAESTNHTLFLSIQNKMRPTLYNSATYFVTMVLFLSTPFVGLIHQRRDLLNAMIYPFDLTPLYNYLPIVFMSIWFSFLNGSMLFCGATLMAEIMLHLNGRYLQLGEDLQHSSKQLLKLANCDTMSWEFSQEVKQILQRNVELNKFAAEFQNFFSFRIFMIFSFAALVLCVVGFKIYTNVAENIAFVFWMLGKVVEILALGEVGSTLIATTNDVSSMYYNSNWELIISCSTNNRESIQLMKLLVTAIETNRKPFVLTGLHFFSVSLAAVLAILQGAASYFTCLISFRRVA